MNRYLPYVYLLKRGQMGAGICYVFVTAIQGSILKIENRSWHMASDLLFYWWAL